MYHHKYLKYKQKYLNAKKLYFQNGASNKDATHMFKLGKIIEIQKEILKKQNDDIESYFNKNIDMNNKVHSEYINELKNFDNTIYKNDYILDKNDYKLNTNNIYNSDYIFNKNDYIFDITGKSINYNDLKLIYKIITTNPKLSPLSKNDLNLLVNYNCANNQNYKCDESNCNKKNTTMLYYLYKNEQTINEINKIEVIKNIYEKILLKGLKLKSYLLISKNKNIYEHYNAQYINYDNKIRELQRLIK